MSGPAHHGAHFVERRKQQMKSRMKKLIYNAKRFIHSLKVRWRIRKTPKFMRKFEYWWHMAAYDTAQVLKGVRPMTGDTLDSMADMVGIERQEGETDEELRKRIIEIVKKKGGMAR